MYVGRVPDNTREKDIERFFKGYGKLRDVLMKPGYTFVVRLFEPRREKTGFLHMRKQRRRSVTQRS